MRKPIRLALVALGLTLAGAPGAAAQGKGDMAMDDKTTMVGGQAMFPPRTSWTMRSTRRITPPWSRRSRPRAWWRRLKGKGPFTVFAPTNAAFAALPAGHRADAAQAREQGAARQGPDLSRRARRLDAESLMKAIKKGERHGHAHDRERRIALGHDERRPQRGREGCQGRSSPPSRPTTCSSRTGSSTWWTRCCCRADVSGVAQRRGHGRSVRPAELLHPVDGDRRNKA